MSDQPWSPKKQPIVSSSIGNCNTCGQSMKNTTTARLEGAGYACAGMLAGSLIMSWRRHLSFKMNLLAWVYDRLELFPNQVSVRNEQQSMDLVKRIRFGWKIAEYLPCFEGPRVQKTMDIAVPSREKDRTILCRAYRPNARGVLPVVLFVHGGGYSFGSIYVYDSLVRDLANRSKCCVVSVDYRLSPEHKFPSGLEDCEDVLSWIASIPTVLTQDMGSDPNQLAICGDSAGGTFCASLAVYAKQKSIRLSLQCLLYPNTSQYSIPHWRESQLPLPSDSAVLYSHGPMLNHTAVVWGCGTLEYSPRFQKFKNTNLSFLKYQINNTHSQGYT